MTDLAAPVATLDHRTYELLLSLKDSLQAPEPASGQSLQQASLQLCEHLLQRYRAPRPARCERVALAPWQERKAKEIMAGSLSSRLFIAEVAEQCALSRSHFSRAFKKATGLSPQEWSLHYRIRRAKELLLNPGMPISRISQECGFSDQSHFCRVFNKLEGTTPNKWRRFHMPDIQAASA
ncbi:AraC family transcriptional regulator [Pseudomonas sp. USHLN015]|uniref:AraC family transcriptional regulator n=1 Tax=Pseudomonas sp. USHLN015 TaxID=3081296 RepID=UPI00301E0EBF